MTNQTASDTKRWTVLHCYVVTVLFSCEFLHELRYYCDVWYFYNVLCSIFKAQRKMYFRSRLQHLSVEPFLKGLFVKIQNIIICGEIRNVVNNDSDVKIIIL